MNSANTIRKNKLVPTHLYPQRHSLNPTLHQSDIYLWLKKKKILYSKRLFIFDDSLHQPIVRRLIQATHSDWPFGLTPTTQPISLCVQQQTEKQHFTAPGQTVHDQR